MKRTTFQTIIQKLHFASNNMKGPNDKAVKIRLLHLLLADLGENKSQSIDKHICTLKWKSSMKQYIKTNSIK